MRLNERPFPPKKVWSLQWEALWSLWLTSLHGPLTIVAGDFLHLGILPLLARSLRLKNIVDVIHFAKSFKEGDEIEELGV